MFCFVRDKNVGRASLDIMDGIITDAFRFEAASFERISRQFNVFLNAWRGIQRADVTDYMSIYTGKEFAEILQNSV